MTTGIAGLPAAPVDATATPIGHASEIALLSSIAHELRTPLSALMASAEMLQVAGAAEQPQFAAIIERQAQRLTCIVEGLLEVFRASNGGLERVSEVVDAAAFFEELCAEQQTAFPQHEFVVDAPPGNTLVPDRRLVAMIVSNLLSNAAKYSPAGSTVSLSCMRYGGGTQIRVCDEGAGVSRDLQHRLFELGEQGDEQARGHGLGLYIAKRLCDAIGARIAVEESTQGGCFAVTFAD